MQYRANRRCHAALRLTAALLGSLACNSEEPAPSDTGWGGAPPLLPGPAGNSGNPGSPGGRPGVPQSVPPGGGGVPGGGGSPGSVPGGTSIGGGSAGSGPPGVTTPLWGTDPYVSKPLKPKPEPDVKFSLERGWYSGAQTITLTPKVAGASVTYALGGELPSKEYTGPIHIADNGALVTVRARAIAGGVPGPLQTHSYVFRPDVGGVVVVVTNNDLTAPADEVETPVTFEFIPSPQTGLPAVAEEAGNAPNMGGQSSGQSDKLYFRGHYGNGTLDADLFGDLYFGVRKPTLHHDHLFLRADHRDFTFLRNVMAHDSLLALGQLSPHGRFVDYFENGNHQGTRYLLERPEGGFMESYTGIDKKRWIAVSGVDAVGTSLDPLVTTFSTWAEVIQTINVHSLVDYLLVQWHAGVKDFLPEAKNWRATGPIGLGEGHSSLLRWHFFNWDIDRGYMREYLTFGSPKGIWERIEQFPEARFIFQDRLHCAFFNNGPLTVPAMMARFNARYTQLHTTSLLTARSYDFSLEPPRLALEIEPWLVARRALLFSTVFTTDMAPAKLAVNVSVTDDILTLTNPNGGAVFYRLDGGDPRTLNGALDPMALRYEGPVALPPGRSGVVARSYDETAPNLFDRWSPSCDRPLVVGEPAAP